MQSRFGRPEMDESIDTDVPSVPPRGSLRNDEEYEDDERDSGSDESVWGTVNGNFCINDILNDQETKRETNVVDEDVGGWGDNQFYIPEPVISFTNRKKPAVPGLSTDSLPFGCHVWVADEEDVQLLLREYWDSSFCTVCNGRIQGTVVRHSGNVTLVLFRDEHLEMSYSLSLPRACLSKTPIKAYDRSGHESNCLAVSCFGLGNLDPRAWGTQRYATDYPGASTAASTHRLNRQFYESLSVMEVKVPQLNVVQEHLLEGSFTKAKRILDTMLAETVHRVDILVLRSRANIFLSRYAEALSDAEEVINLDPRWVKGYLSAARAFCGLGKFSAALLQVSHAILLLPHSRELRKIEELNIFLQNVQKELTRKDLNLYLDSRYAKHLVTNRVFKKSETVYAEDRVVLAMESMLVGSSGRCCVCLKPAGELKRVPLDSSDNASNEFAFYCSADCQQRSSLFLPMELGRHRVAVERARGLIASSSVCRARRRSFEMAYMVTRLFLVICVTHDRLSSQRRHLRRLNDGSTSSFSLDGSKSAGLERCGSSPIPLQAALQHLGVYPLVTDQLSDYVQEEMRIVYNTITAFFTEEEKHLYPFTLFYALYEYVQTFVVGVDTHRKDGSLLYYLPKLMGAVSRVPPMEANCVVTVDEESARISLVAARDIAANEELSIAIWDSSTSV